MFKVELLQKNAPYASNCYSVLAGNEYLIIDPSSPPKDGMPAPKYILLTHSHFDHILCLDEWAQLGSEVLICEDEILGPSDPDFNCFSLFFGKHLGYQGKIRGLSDGEQIALGDETLTLMKTPGHTKGSSVFLMQGAAFVGDTVFAGGGFGRTDLPSGSYSQLKGSIEKITKLPKDTLLYPGHGEAMTVEEFINDYRFI